MPASRRDILHAPRRLSAVGMSGYDAIPYFSDVVAQEEVRMLPEINAVLEGLKARVIEAGGHL